MKNQIDTSFDFRTDAGGKDPDEHSPTLRSYHKLLWSKTLPNGKLFNLVEDGSCLRHQSSLGEFTLSSDTAVPTFLTWKRMQHIALQLTAREKEEFVTIRYSIGSMIIFPANKVDGQLTINGARGFNQRIADRFDLTLECIRLQYKGEGNPLSDTLSRYADFFKLFESFQGYVDFFYLNDLVDDDYLNTKFFMPFDNFKSPVVPHDVFSYREFRRRSIDFIKARNRRIDRRDEKPDHAKSQLKSS